MPIKPEDEVTITTTYRELALCYAVLGKISFKGEMKLWIKLREMLDPEQRVYDSLIYSKDFSELEQYSKIKDKWEGLLFPQKPVETQQQIQIRELREQAEALLQKAKELEGGVL